MAPSPVSAARLLLILLIAAISVPTVIAVSGCRSRTPAPQKSPLEEVWTPAEEDVFPAVRDLRIEKIEELGGHRYAHEVAGTVVALYETGLADLTGVVPHYESHGPPPGIDHWLTGGSKHWTARFSFAYDRDSLQIVLRLCVQGGACKGASASGPRESPEGAVTELLVWTAGQLEAPVPAGMVETWSKPLSSDRYAVLVLGRAAASWYGIVDPVDPEERGIPGRDPLARVVLIDPSMSLAHYILGRRALDIGRANVAARAFERARETTPDRFVFEVAVAAAAAASGLWADARKKFDDLEARWPDDSRFVIPRLEAYLATDMAKEAQTLIDELPARFDRDPEVARLRVGVAEKLGPGPDFEQLITAWEEAAEHDPEPVRRHIALRLRDGRFEEAFALLGKLEARGATSEAKQMTIALGADIGRFEDAAKQAALAGSEALAERLRLRAALDKDPRSIPPALLRIPDLDARLLAAKLRAPTDPAGALAEVQSLLREDRFLAEAIALEVSLLERLGKSDEAVRARERLQFADPAFASGPRIVAGASAGAAGGGAAGLRGDGPAPPAGDAGSRGAAGARSEPAGRGTAPGLGAPAGADGRDGRKPGSSSLGSGRVERDSESSGRTAGGAGRGAGRGADGADSEREGREAASGALDGGRAASAPLEDERVDVDSASEGVEAVRSALRAEAGASGSLPAESPAVEPASGASGSEGGGGGGGPRTVAGATDVGSQSQPSVSE
jgi:tetratricopeptide (TPR) repeat protein